MKNQRAKLSLSLLFALFLTISAFAQSPFVSISGKVVDTNSAVIIGGRVEVENKTTKKKLETTTDNHGDYRFSELKTGLYQLKVSAPGFSETLQIFDLDRSRLLNITLRPANIAETVSVTSSYLAGTADALIRTPGSIQVITREELESARVFNFAEALRKVSGVYVRNEEGFGLRPNISIRGSDPTRSRKVLLLEDGIPLSYAPYGDNSSYYHPPIERFESVEVLKGSGQIEFGPVTVAGVVNYITPNPSPRPTFSLKVIGGNRDYFNSSAGFNGSFGDTGILISFTRKQGAGSRVNLRSGLNDFSSKVIHTLNDSNVLTFKYSHFYESSRLTYSGLTEAEFAADPRQNPFRNDDLEFFRDGLSVSHSALLGPNASLTTNFYTSYFSRDWWRQSSNSDQRPNRLGSDPDCLSMADLSTTCGNQGTPRDFLTYGIEPRFNFQFDLGPVRNELKAGVRFHREKQNRRAFNGDSPNSRDGQVTEMNLRENTAYSGFFQNRFVWRNFSFTPGLRVERVSFKRVNLLNGANAETNLTQLIPGFGAAFNPHTRFTVFAGVHRGFAPPGTSDILTNSGGVVDLDAELSWNYEAGVRLRPLDALMIEATYFRNEYQNQIVPASVAGGVGATNTNGGSTLQEGFEINSRIDSGPIFQTDYNLFLQTAFTYLRTARFESIRFSGITGFEDVPINGNRLPYAPQTLLNSSAGFNYRKLDGFVEMNYIGRQFSDDLNTLEPTANGQRGIIPGQIYFNSTLNYRIEKLDSTFFITAKNIFDRLFIVDRSRGIYPSSPRLIQMGWRWNFSR